MKNALTSLKKIPLFSELDLPELKRVAALARVHEAPKGALVFEKSMAGNHLFIVMKGRIKIYSEMEGSSKRKTFAYLSAGDFFGEMSLLDRHGRSLSACALESAELLSLSRQEFQTLLKRRPDFALKVIKTLIERLRKANEEIESLTFRSLYGRVCRKLLEISEGKSNGGTASITHYELADLTGTAREMVTKILSSLRRMQVIRYVGDSRIEILKSTKLKELAQVEN